MRCKVLIAVAVLLTSILIGQGSTGENDTAKPVQSDEVEKRIVTIRIVDNQQQPIQGAIIRLDGLRPVDSMASHYGYRDPIGVEFITDLNGIAQVEYPRYVQEHVETGAISFQISHPNYPDMSILSYKIDGSEVPIVMLPGAEMVVVALLDDAPVREFTVHQGSSETTFKSQILEDADGRLIQGIKEGSYPIYLHYVDQTGLEYYSAVEIFEAKAGVRHQVKLELYPALSLKGIFDASVPRPIINGCVRVNMINETREMDRQMNPTESASVHRIFSADVKADGSFSFLQLPKGYGEVIAICDGFASKIDRGNPEAYFQNQHFDLQGDGQEIIVEMEPTATFSGKVVNTDGQPVEGAEVIFTPNVFWGNFFSQLFMGPTYEDMQRELKSADLAKVSMEEVQELMLRYTPSASTNAEGEFSVSNLPAHGRLIYIVGSADYMLPAEAPGNMPSRRTREIELSPGQEVYEIIQVIPLRQEQIEARVKPTPQGEQK